MSLEPKYAEKLGAVVTQFDPDRANRYFVFGSSVRERTYRDIDLGVVGNSKSQKPLAALRGLFYDSTIPYAVDVVDFDAAAEDFKSYVLENEPIVWIR